MGAVQGGLVHVYLARWSREHPKHSLGFDRAHLLTMNVKNERDF